MTDDEDFDRAMNKSASSPSPTPKPRLPIYTNPPSIATASTNEEDEEPKKRGRGPPPKLDRAIPGSSLEAYLVKKKVAEGIRKSTRTKNNYFKQ